MKAISIIWDTDEFDAGRLPDEIEIPEEIEDDIDAISDYITDMTGFCHKGFQLDSEARLTDSKGTDMEMLKKICYLLHIDETSGMALPLVFYRNHLLISADYFRSDEALFKLIYTNIFKTKPENMVSFRYSIKFGLHRRVTDRKWKTEAVLYDGNGRQMAYCESEDHFIGEWILKNPDGTEYCVHVRFERS